MRQLNMYAVQNTWSGSFDSDFQVVYTARRHGAGAVQVCLACTGQCMLPAAASALSRRPASLLELHFLDERLLVVPDVALQSPHAHILHPTSAHTLAPVLRCCLSLHRAGLRVTEQARSATHVARGHEPHLPDGDLLLIADPDLLSDLVDQPEVVRHQLHTGQALHELYEATNRLPRSAVQGIVSDSRSGGPHCNRRRRLWALVQHSTYRAHTS